MRSMSGAQLAQILGDWPARLASGPGYAQLTAATRSLILDGRLPIHTRLPSERDLAAALGVSRTMVTAAYDALHEGGFVARRQGSGTWTALPTTHAMNDDNAPWALFAPADANLINLTQASPSAPSAALRAAYEAALEQAPRYFQGSGYYLRGLPELRSVVAERFTARGLPTTPDQILITAGAQQAFSLILAALTSPGDRVLVEHPTYPNTLDAARLAGARLVPVAFAYDGWDVDAFAAALRQTAPRVAALVPDFNNPTGLLASAETRAALGERLTSARTLTVIDESLVDLNLDGESMPPPFATFLADDLTFTIGSVDKCVWGGIRVGWVRAEESMIRRLASVRATNDLSSATLEQLAVTHVLPNLESVMTQRCAELREQRDVLLAALSSRLPTWSARTPPGGLVVWADMATPVSTALVGAAERHGVALASGTRFGVDGAFERRLRLPYTLPTDVLTDAVDRIAAAFYTVPESEGLRHTTLT